MNEADDPTAAGPMVAHKGLTAEAETLRATGLTADEALLIAARRLAATDPEVRAFARQHFAGIWNEPEPSTTDADERDTGRRGFWVMAVFAAAAAVAVRLPEAVRIRSGRLRRCQLLCAQRQLARLGSAGGLVRLAEAAAALGDSGNRRRLRRFISGHQRLSVRRRRFDLHARRIAPARAVVAGSWSVPNRGVLAAARPAHGLCALHRRN